MNYIVFTAVVYYTFYRDSLQWRAFAPNFRPKSALSADIDETRSLIDKRQDLEDLI